MSSWEDQAVGGEMGIRKGYATYLHCLLYCSPWGRCSRWVVLFHKTVRDDFYRTAVPLPTFDKLSQGAQPLQWVSVKPLRTDWARMGQVEQAGEQVCTKIWNGHFRVVVSGDVSALGKSPVGKPNLPLLLLWLHQREKPVSSEMFNINYIAGKREEMLLGVFFGFKWGSDI